MIQVQVELIFVLLPVDLELLEGAIASPLTFLDAPSSRGQVVQFPADRQIISFDTFNMFYRERSIGYHLVTNRATP